jgi:hypothetical protein
MIKFPNNPKIRKIEEFQSQIAFPRPAVGTFRVIFTVVFRRLYCFSSTGPLCLGPRLNLDRGIGRLRSGAGLF